MNRDILDRMVNRHPVLEEVKTKVENAAAEIIACYVNGGKVLLCGNGGSCADAGHIVGELMKSFEKPRPLDNDFEETLKKTDPERGKFLASKLEKGLPAISLNAHSELFSAILNDIAPELVFAQQVYVYGQSGDVLFGISSSGNSRNVLDALITAKAKSLITIGLTGGSGGKMKEHSDVLINVPGNDTALVQELHLPVYHTICRIVEDHFFS